MADNEKVIEAVRTGLSCVLDPELGLDIDSLGLVYDIRVEGDMVVVDMTLTTPGCPVSESLPLEAQEAAQTALLMTPGLDARVDVVWDPPWTIERIDPDAAREIGLMV